MTLAFRPFAGTHAIEACHLVIRFAQAIDPLTMSAVHEEAVRLAKELDLPATQQMLNPTMFIGAAPAGPMPMVGSNSYQRYAPDGTVQVELRCDPFSIQLTTRKYDGWASLRDFIDKSMIRLLPIYLRAVSAITSVMTQYDDRFVANEAGATPPADDLFRQESRWVTLYDPSTTQGWHSHFGIFLAESEEKRQLVNVNVTVSDQLTPEGALQRGVALVVLVSEAYDIPGKSPLILEADNAADTVRDLFDKAHDRQKSILQEVLTDPYLDAIGAKGQQ